MGGFLDDDHKENVQLIGKLMKDKRWKITDRLKEKVVDVLDEALSSGDAEICLKAVDLVLKADALNLAAEKLDGDPGAGLIDGNEKVVLLLPPNGTEGKM
jgi:hypothetical protein